MRIADKHIAEFQALYLKHFGEEISKEEAREKGARLVRLVKITTKHHTQPQSTEIK